ncbi:Variant surface glycoprotein [Trypanosoma congolense IL3000]|uniref:Variant surface glycoprotein n=1 Tax=Trypanosoma congolense (strain IL3000) TaxID=1068625 RepID=F9W6M7_TRYCI|nr:Variant surface glycoprotein [Trypanosoma congolense IL3000]
MLFWMFLGVFVIVGRVGSVGARTESPTHHNKNEHDVLCGLLGVAVERWKTTNNPTAKKALSRAIFGHRNGGIIETLMEKLPNEYNEPGSRENACGSCTYSDGKHYPGWSIPHDLICMCTVGENGYPFGQNSNDNGTPTLCGRSATDFGCEQNQGNGNGCHGNKDWWKESSHHDGNGNRQASKHLNATWEKVIKPCLIGGEKLQLEVALKNLTGSRKDRETPSWASGHGKCNGVSGAVCVYYGTGCDKQYNNNSPQWWWDLEKALTTPNLTEAQLNSTTFLSASLDMDHNLEGVHGGHGVGTSSSSSSQQAGSTTHHPDEPRNRLASLFSKHDGTPLTSPFLWSLGAFVSWF